LLQQLEAKSTQPGNTLPAPAANVQLSIFDAHTEAFETIRNLLEKTDINALTPVEALVMLSEIKKRLG